MRSLAYEKQREYNDVLSRLDAMCVTAERIALPKLISMAICTACDLRCPYCPRQHQGVPDSGFMNMEDFKSVISQCGGVEKAVLFGLGEPFLNKRIFEYVEFCHQYGVEVHITCHAGHINEERARQIVDMGVEELAISMDAAEPELFSKLRKNSDLELVKKNVRYLADVKAERNSPYPMLLIPATISQENIHQMPLMARLAHQLGASVLIFSDLIAVKPEFAAVCTAGSDEYTRYFDEAVAIGKELGIIVVRNYQKKLPWVHQSIEGEGLAQVCEFAWHNLIIERKGNSKFCCFVGDKMVSGFGGTRIQDVYNSEMHLEKRGDLVAGRVRTECRGCGYLSVNIVERSFALLDQAKKKVDDSKLMTAEDKATLYALIKEYRRKTHDLFHIPAGPMKSGVVRDVFRKVTPAPVRKALREMALRSF